MSEQAYGGAQTSPQQADGGIQISPQQASVAQPAASMAGQSRHRRLLAEVLIVLAIFPLPYVVNAVAALVQAVATGSEPGRVPLPVTGHPGLSFLVDLPLIPGLLT
jgi:hypothetical protein